MRSFEDLDVSSPKFSFSRAECEVKKQGCRMLCDALLDQAVLPGVGNIIKNEALFDSGLHPAVQVKHKNLILYCMEANCCHSKLNKLPNCYRKVNLIIVNIL